MDPTDLGPFEAVVLALAAYRLTRLVVVDTIWMPTRNRLLSWLDNPRRSNRAARFLGDKTAEALSCAFCAGVWVTVATVVAWVHGGDVARWVIVVAAIVGVQALLSAVDAALEDR